MKYKTQIKISKDDVDFVNKVMEIRDETDERWEDYEDLRDCTAKRYTGYFEDGHFADVSVCSGQSNFFIDPVLFNKDGHEVCVLECADDILGEYEFEDNGNIYILEIVQEEEVK
jgi:hypothetical protein